MRELCDAHGALLVLDEIQCGMGRSGQLFAHWHDQVVPDVVTLAKALGGGFPIGAMLAGPQAAEAMGFGAHGSTFGGNPLAAAVARVALEKLSSREIASNVSRQSAALRAGLAAINDGLGLFAEVRGRGLMVCAELVAPDASGRPLDGAEVARLDRKAWERGAIVSARGQVVRLAPPLCISREEVDRLVDIVAASIAELEAELT